MRQLLVWYEIHETMQSAIDKEKALKFWKRDWKIRLIEKEIQGGETYTESYSELDPGQKRARMTNVRIFGFPMAVPTISSHH